MGCGQSESSGKCIRRDQGRCPSLNMLPLAQLGPVPRSKLSPSPSLVGGCPKTLLTCDNGSPHLAPLKTVSRPHPFIRKPSQITSPRPSVLHKRDPGSQPGPLPVHPIPHPTASPQAPEEEKHTQPLSSSQEPSAGPTHCGWKGPVDEETKQPWGHLKVSLLGPLLASPCTIRPHLGM